MKHSETNEQETPVNSGVLFRVKDALDFFREDTSRHILVIADRVDKLPNLSLTIRESLSGLGLQRLSVRLSSISNGRYGPRLFTFCTPGQRVVGLRFDGVLLKSSKTEEVLESEWFTKEVIPQLTRSN